MPDPSVHVPIMSDPHDAEVAEYRALSTLAVVGLIFGLLSAAALVDPFAWCLPLLGVLFSLGALRRIARAEPALVGRKAALIGLVLALLMGSTALGQWGGTRYLLRRQARQFATVWFDALRGQQPQVAHQLTQRPKIRRPLDAALWEFYRTGPDRREQLEEYTAQPLVHTLLALGEGARVRYCGTRAVGRYASGFSVFQIFAVTFDQAGRRTTFFVGVDARRTAPDDSGKADWYLAGAKGGIDPEASEDGG